MVRPAILPLPLSIPNSDKSSTSPKSPKPGLGRVISRLDVQRDELKQHLAREDIRDLTAEESVEKHRDGLSERVDDNDKYPDEWD